MVRGVIGILVGAVVWLAAFYAQVIAAAAVWLDYRAHGRVWQSEGVFEFTSPMAVMMLVFWAIAALAGGWSAMKIGKRQWTVWVLAGLIGAYVFAIHTVLFWPTFPWWYNLGVVIPAMPAILLGARLAGGAAARRAAA